MGNESVKKRVVAYARVSTNKNDQKNSLENQRTYFKRELERNSDYRMVKRNIEGVCDNGVYYDRGISGTKVSRPAFDRLLEDAGLSAIIDADTEKKTTTYKIVNCKPKFDVIFVKDTSRFARNVSINILLRTLRENNVFVTFLDIGKTTEKEEDFVVIQVFLSLAERESADRRAKVSFGYREGIRQGKIYFGGKMIGYDYNHDENKLVINEEEAKIVRRVFDLYTEEGLGQYRICNQLYDEGFLNGAGKRYTRSTIKRMLQNEKYCGITNSGRFHKVDLFSNKRENIDYNDPLRKQAREAQQRLLEQGIVKIEPIISVEQFEKAQKINSENSERYSVTKEWHGTTVYAKKVVCGCCGAYYRAQGRKYYKQFDKKICVYTCKNRVDAHASKKCKNPSIKEPYLDNALNSFDYYKNKLNSMDELLYKGDRYIEILKSALDQDKSVKADMIRKQLLELEEQNKRIVRLYSKGTFTESELDEVKQEITNQIAELTPQLDMLTEGNNEIYRLIDSISEMMQQAQKEYKEIETIISTREYPKKSVKELIRDVKQIVIDIEGNPIIEFKSIGEIDEYIRNMEDIIGVYTSNEIGANTTVKSVIEKAVSNGVGYIAEKA